MDAGLIARSKVNAQPQVDYGAAAARALMSECALRLSRFVILASDSKGAYHGPQQSSTILGDGGVGALCGGLHNGMRNLFEWILRQLDRELLPFRPLPHGAQSGIGEWSSRGRFQPTGLLGAWSLPRLLL